MRILALTAAVLLMAGCSQSGDEQAEQSHSLTPLPQRSAAAPSASSSKPATTSAVPTAAPTPGTPIPGVSAWIEAGSAADASGFHTATRDGVSTPLGDYVAFVTPSGKTKCMTDEKSDGALACLVSLTNPPPRPADTYGEWVGGWVDFDGTTVQVGSARADPGQFGAGTGAELPYGNTLKFGDYQCRSDQSGLFCVNFAHQSGVRLSDAGIEPFGCLQKAEAPADIGAKFACN